MGNPIKSEDLVKDNILEKPIKQFDELINRVDILETAIVNFAKKAEASLKGLKIEGLEDIEKLQVIIEKVDKASKASTEATKIRKNAQDDLNKTQKSSIKIQEQVVKNIKEESKSLEVLQANLDSLRKQRSSLNKAEKEGLISAQEANKQRAEINVLIKQASKQLNDEQKAILKQVDAYSELVDATNDAQKQFKILAAQFGINSKEAKDARKEFNRLDKELREINDSAKDGRRDVGRYSDALKETKDNLKGIQGELQDARTDLTNFAAAAITAVVALKGLETSVDANEKSSEKLRKTQSQLGGAFSAIKNAIGGTIAAGIDFFKIIQGIDDKGISLTNTLDELSEATSNLGQKIKDGAIAAGEASDATFNLEKAQRGLQQAVAVLNGEIEKQNLISGDTTRGFDEQEEAAQRSTRLQIERALILQKLALEEVNIIEKQIAAQGKGAQTVQLQNELSAKRIELTEIQNELDLATLDNEKVIREVRRDRFERELDFTIDAFDAQKTVNERLIADDRKTLAERQSIFERTVELTESSFANQIKLVEGFTQQTLNLNELVKIDDEEVIRARLRGRNLDDVTLGRILEIIRERKLILQDIADLEREITDAIQEQLDVRLQAIDDVDNVLREREIDRINRELENEELSTEKRIELINERTEKEEEILRNNANTLLRNDELTAEQRKVIEEQLINDLANLENSRLDDVDDVNDLILESDKKLAEKRKEELVEFTEFASDVLSELNDVITDDFDEKNKQTEQEIEKREGNVQTQRDLAAKGLENTLQEEEKQLAESRIRQQQELERQQKIEEAIRLTQAYFAAFQARVAEDPNSAPFLALRDVLLAKGIATGIKGLVGGFAYDGVDNTGPGGNIDNKGGMLYVVHPDEQIWSKQNVADGGDRTRAESIDILNRYDNGQLQTMVTTPQINTNIFKSNPTQLEKGFASLKSEMYEVKIAIQNKPVQQVDVDSFGNLRETFYREGRKDVIIHKRKSRV